MEKEDRARPSPSGSFGSLQVPRDKAIPSEEMQEAVRFVNEAFRRGKITAEVDAASSVILNEWFKVAGTKNANPLDVENYLDFFKNYSQKLIRYIVNMPDGDGNTVLHYAVLHGNFDVVSILLDANDCDPNKANKAGHTSLMLVSLVKVLTETGRQVVHRLLRRCEVNLRTSQHGQTAVMLAASHGRLDIVKQLIEAGAHLNIQDEMGTTSLMYAAEHGHRDTVEFILSKANCNPGIMNNEKRDAFDVAMGSGHEEIGAIIDAKLDFISEGAGCQSSST